MKGRQKTHGFRWWWAGGAGCTSCLFHNRDLYAGHVEKFHAFTRRLLGERMLVSCLAEEEKKREQTGEDC